jgi:hypothetical protein
MSLRRCNCEQFEALSTDYGNLLRQSNAFEIERDTAREQLVKLRKAAIRFMASDIAKKHSDYGCVDCIAEALKDIGEIPP